MNKETFLASLDAALGQIPPEARRATLDYYEEIIDDRMEDGMPEEDAVAAMGDVRAIAQQVLEEMPLTTLVRTRVARVGVPLWLTILLLVLGSPVWLPLTIAFAAVALAIYICIWSVIFSIWACVAAFLLAGPALLVFLLWFRWNAFPSLLFALGSGAMVFGLGFLLLQPCILLTKALVRLTAAVGRGIKRLFIRKGRI